MDIEQHNESAFAPISPAFAAKVFSEETIIENFFT
jgi:hypothetical protein